MNPSRSTVQKSGDADRWWRVRHQLNRVIRRSHRAIEGLVREGVVRPLDHRNCVSASAWRALGNGGTRLYLDIERLKGSGRMRPRSHSGRTEFRFAVGGT
jgi:hypothetical protein